MCVHNSITLKGLSLSFYFYTWKIILKNMSLYHLHISYKKKTEECIRFPGAVVQVVLSHLMRALGIKTGSPIAQVLRQLSNTQICHYNSEDEDAPWLLLFSLTWRWWKFLLHGLQRIEQIPFPLWMGSAHFFLLPLTQFSWCEWTQWRV